jgi:hypothetical protein
LYKSSGPLKVLLGFLTEFLPEVVLLLKSWAVLLYRADDFPAIKFLPLFCSTSFCLKSCMFVELLAIYLFWFLGLSKTGTGAICLAEGPRKFFFIGDGALNVFFCWLAKLCFLN